MSRKPNDTAGPDLEADALRDLLDELGAQLPRPLLRERVLRSTMGDQRLGPSAREQLRTLFHLDEAQATALVARMNSVADWTPGAVPGLSFIAVTPEEAPKGPLPDGPTRLLVRLEPGLPFPMHGHDGHEEMLVLEGAFVTDGGARVAAGQTLKSEPGSAHAFRIDEQEECIAAVRLTDGIHLVPER